MYWNATDIDQQVRISDVIPHPAGEISDVVPHPAGMKVGYHKSYIILLLIS